MKMVLITEEFALANKEFRTSNSVFGYSITNDGRYVTPESSINAFPELFKNTSFQKVEITREDFQPNFNPPPSNGFGLVIPDTYQWVFPIQISGYRVELKQLENGTKYIEKSCLDWKAFLNEFGKEENQGYKNTIYKIWIYANTEAQTIEL